MPGSIRLRFIKLVPLISEDMQNEWKVNGQTLDKHLPPPPVELQYSCKSMVLQNVAASSLQKLYYSLTW